MTENNFLGLWKTPEIACENHNQVGRIPMSIYAFAEIK